MSDFETPPTIRVTCPNCGYINLIPVEIIFQSSAPIRCEGCQKLIPRPILK